MCRAIPANVSSWPQKFIRFGYATKGVLYGLIGFLAAQMALGARQRAPDPKHAIREINAQPIVGDELVLVIAAGLAIYACWRFVQALLDVDDHHNSVLHRIAYAVSGGSYALIALYAMNVGIGLRTSKVDKKQLGSQLMETSWGPWVIGGLGVILLVHGGLELFKALKGSFMKNYRQNEMSRTTKRLALIAGTIGIAARALTFFMIGWFTIRAAKETNAHQLKGLGDAFRMLDTGVEGPVLLISVAVGFMLYGIYCFANAWYRRLNV
jgi:hypothetical protein